MPDQDRRTAYEERLQKVREGLADSGGVIKDWMYYSISRRELKEIWTSGEWIDWIGR